MKPRDWRAFAAGAFTIVGCLAAYVFFYQMVEYANDLMGLNTKELSLKYSWQIPNACGSSAKFAITPDPCKPPMPEASLWIAIAAFAISVALSFRVWLRPKK